MYPNKYICVTHITKNISNIIIKANVLKVYDSLEDCKKHLEEIKFFKKLYKSDFDIIYGDYEDYEKNRKFVIDAFEAFGAISFEMQGFNIDDFLHALGKVDEK